MDSAVLMYHFIKGNESGTFSKLKGISVDQFHEQLKFLLKKYRIISHRDILRAVEIGKFPDNSFYLTFDDGTKDHINKVLPVLKEYGLTASFFPVPQPLIEKKVPVIEKQRFLQYIGFDHYTNFLEIFCRIAAEEVPKKIRNSIIYSKKNIKEYSNYLCHHHFYSDEERFYRKIRNELINPDVFKQIIDQMFDNFYPDETDFINEFYMSFEDLKLLKSEGMTIGAHTYSHCILSQLNNKDAKNEILSSINLLEEKLSTSITSFAYPNGIRTSFSEVVLSGKKVKYAFEVENQFVNAKFHPLRIPRIDCASFNQYFK